MLTILLLLALVCLIGGRCFHCLKNNNVCLRRNGKQKAILFFCIIFTIYCGSYLWEKECPFSHQCKGGFFVLEEDFWQDVPGLYIEGTGGQYDPIFVSRQMYLYRIYYPLIKLDRLSGNYFIFDNNIPNMGG